MSQGDVEPVLGPALGTSCNPVDLVLRSVSRAS